MARAYEEARVTAADVALIDLHATGTPGDLNELALIEGFVNERTSITARKGQLGHGMANSGGWELTALALGLRAGSAIATGIPAGELHARVPHPGAVVGESRPLAKGVGVKLMLGIGGLTACVVIRAAS
jgi:3-oxoacyl-[acyl-carrier-protein] synthase II